MSAGIYLCKKEGERVARGEPLAILYAEDEAKLSDGERILREAYRISKDAPRARSCVYKVVE
jgi:pyrimidine-nucleoside phosphorylase